MAQHKVISIKCSIESVAAGTPATRDSELDSEVFPSSRIELSFSTPFEALIGQIVNRYALLSISENINDKPTAT